MSRKTTAEFLVAKKSSLRVMMACDCQEGRVACSNPLLPALVVLRELNNSR